MTDDSLLNRDWLGVVERLGGADALEISARETKAFRRPRAVKSAVDMLRLVLAYCMGAGGLRSVAAWAAAIGLVEISNVGLLYRLRQSGDWLSLLISRMLADATPKPAQGRLIRLVDATVVPKAGCATKRKNAVWRIHSVFELPSERFGSFELTDEKGGERLDRIPVIKGEIRSLPQRRRGATALICSPTASRPFWTAAAMWCFAPAGGTHAGRRRPASQSICSLNSARQRMG